MSLRNRAINSRISKISVLETKKKHVQTTDGLLLHNLCVRVRHHGTRQPRAAFFESSAFLTYAETTCCLWLLDSSCDPLACNKQGGIGSVGALALLSPSQPAVQRVMAHALANFGKLH
eukprot:1617538-Amphidinium_carterae.1